LGDGLRSPGCRTFLWTRNTHNSPETLKLRARSRCRVFCRLLSNCSSAPPHSLIVTGQLGPENGLVAANSLGEPICSSRQHHPRLPGGDRLVFARIETGAERVRTGRIDDTCSSRSLAGVLVRRSATVPGRSRYRRVGLPRGIANGESKPRGCPVDDFKFHEIQCSVCSKPTTPSAESKVLFRQILFGLLN